MITIEAENLEPIIKTLANFPGALEKVTRRAISRTLKGARRDAGTFAKKRYTLPAGIVTKSLSISVHGFSGELKSRGGRNPLEKAKVTPAAPIRSRAKYIRATVVKGQGGLLKRAFRKESGGGIFQRMTVKRFPIRKLKTVSAPGMLSHPTVSNPLQDKMISRFSINFLHEAAFALS